MLKKPQQLFSDSQESCELNHMSMLCWLADDSDSKHMEIVVQWQQQVSIELLTYLQGCLTYACLALDEIEDRLGLVLLRDLPQPNGCLSIDVACNLFRTAVDWHIEYCKEARYHP